MSLPVIRPWLPASWRALLWGDRARWGAAPDHADPMWLEWQQTYDRFYMTHQRHGAGSLVNDAGYTIMRAISLAGRRVLEVGAGDIRHSRYWRGRPQHYTLVDVHPEMLARSEQHLQRLGVAFGSHAVTRDAPQLPVGDATIDVLISFYSLEHLHPIDGYLAEWRRVVRPGGAIIGAIPADGGLAWGIGRALTSRRWLQRHTSIDPDRLICWEHPNLADDIIERLDRHFTRRRLGFWPIPVLPSIDASLILRFWYQR
jgi:ubiquinone/menaquinone biosynthesis C-methylase UbiE